MKVLKECGRYVVYASSLPCRHGLQNESWSGLGSVIQDIEAFRSWIHEHSEFEDARDFKEFSGNPWDSEEL